MKSLMQYNLKSAPGAIPGVGSGGGRRGNTMVLVAGILVLLVIIATAFISRAQTTREIASSQLAASKRNDTSHAIADSLAQMISEALFVRKIVNYGPGTNLNNANLPRRGLDSTAVRYSFDFNGSGGNDDYPYNFAPFQVVPYTNWPDVGPPFFLSPDQLPKGPGNTVGGPDPFLAMEGNPLGNPGFSDTRWLRDIEPLRYDNRDDGQLNTFFHWRHLTNIAHANNAWRICRDIANIFNAPDPRITFGGLVLDLNLPVEQWLADPLPSAPLTNFFPIWDDWFSPNYFNNYNDLSGELIPPNFYRLGVFGRPADEFIFASDRNVISRVLADADGDGFTDSFWFLAPTSPDNGIRQIVAVSITDNSGRLNANVATEFNRFNTVGATPADLALVGDYLWNDNVPPTSPLFINNVERVGFFDNPRNHESHYRFNTGIPADRFDTDNPISMYGKTSAVYDTVMWDTKFRTGFPALPENFLGALGVLLPGNNPLPGENFDRNLKLPSTIMTPPEPWPLSVPIDRLFYWQNAGSRPFDAKQSLTPFGTDSELELRMFEGQNYPWIISSFENVMQSVVDREDNNNLPADAIIFPQLLHGNIAREESSEYLDQLNASELLFDARRKLTLFSGARNDLMPPWLWWREIDPPRIADNDPLNIGVFSQIEIDNFFAQSRLKLDLREDAALNQFFFGELTFEERLAPTLLLALTVKQQNGGESYYSDYNDTAGVETERNQLRKLAASYAANIKAYRDPDSISTLFDAEQVPQYGDIPDFPDPPDFNAVARDEMDPSVSLTDRRRYLGFEKQPFLVEAFIGHVHRAQDQDFAHSNLPPPPGKVLCDDPSFSSTIVVVQIANPFDSPIIFDDLQNDFQIKLFNFSNVNITGQLNPGERKTFYLIEDDTAGDVDAHLKWKQVLELEDALGLPIPGVNPVDLLDPVVNPGIFVDVDPVTGNTPGTAWPLERDSYDFVGIADRNIELVRIDNSFGAFVEVVVDRFDMPTRTVTSERFEFGNSVVTELANTRPSGDCGENELPLNAPWIGVRPIAFDNMVFASRVTRVWDLADALPANNLKSPRYIFNDRKVVDTYWPGLGYNNGDDPLNPLTLWFPDDDNRPRFAHRNKRFFGEAGRNFNFPLQMLQKDANFDQVGELLNVWLYSHELRFTDNGALFFIPDTGGTVTGIVTAGLNTNGDPDGGTVRTFSEYLAPENAKLVGDDLRVNRLHIMPKTIDGNDISPVIGVRDASVSNVYNDPMASVPNLPAGARVLDAFVCDGEGVLEDYDNNGFIDLVFGSPDRQFQARFAFNNAGDFSGRMTPGLININTATLEVMRAMPHMSSLVHEDPGNAIENSIVNTQFVALPNAIIHYRERFSGVPSTDPVFNAPRGGYPEGANYVDRIDLPVVDERGDRGFTSIGELLLLEKEADQSILNDPLPFQPGMEWNSEDAWRIDFAAQDPFQNVPVFTPVPVGSGAYLSTDVQDPDPVFTPLDPFSGDGVSEDVEEVNLLFAGISNLITTRSDMFTVHFIIRSFRQNPITGIWDATDQEQIVDERRYVMLVDRSEVNRPTDRPRILYLEKLPN